MDRYFSKLSLTDKLQHKIEEEVNKKGIKKKRRIWTNKEKRDVVDHLRHFGIPSAVKKYKIHRNVLKRWEEIWKKSHAKNIKSHLIVYNKKRGRKTLLPSDIYKNIVEQIEKLFENGHSVNNTSIAIVIRCVCDEYGR